MGNQSMGRALKAISKALQDVQERYMAEGEEYYAHYDEVEDWLEEVSGREASLSSEDLPEARYFLKEGRSLLRKLTGTGYVAANPRRTWSTRKNPAPEVKALRTHFRTMHGNDWSTIPEVYAEYKRQLAAMGKSPYGSSPPKKTKAAKPKAAKPKAAKPKAPAASGALTSQLRQIIPMLNRHIRGTCDRYGGRGMSYRYGSYCKIPPTVTSFDVKRKYIYMIGSTGQQEFRIDPSSGEVWRLSASGSTWFVGTLSDILKRGKTIDETWAENNPERW
jgi:hypothetical protein